MKSSGYKDVLSKSQGVHMLASKILVWEPESKDVIDMNPDVSKCLVLRECESVEIEESYKKLIGTATVKFPRGTIVKRTITKNDIEENGTTNVYTEVLADGTITEKRAGYSTAQPSDFKVGQRIRIYLGYYELTQNAKPFKDSQEMNDAFDKMFDAQEPMFDGYIVKCSVSSPIEIKCENLASNLKRVNCRNIPPRKDMKVNDFLKEGGKYDLLKNTGLKLHPKTAEWDINIGMVKLTEDLTVADLLTEWSKYHLYCFIRTENNVPYLKVGRSYFSNDTVESIVNEDQGEYGTAIQFDYHVADDNLTLISTDPRYLAVSAEGFQYQGNKQIKHSITVRLNPEWTGTKDTEHQKFQLLNETKLSKKAMKMGATTKSSKEKVDLSQYTIIPYVSTRIGKAGEDYQAELIKEAEAYFDGYNMNGIEGTLTLFGDLNLKSGTKVELIDKRQPEKNGWYIVEEVNTTFGVGGYRQTIKIPYCIAKAENESKEGGQ